MPILCSSAPVEAGKVALDDKAVNFSPSTLANRMNTSANSAFVIHIFLPFRT